MSNCPFCSESLPSAGEPNADFCGTRVRCLRCRQYSEASTEITSPDAVKVADPVMTPPAPRGAPGLRSGPRRYRRY